MLPERASQDVPPRAVPGYAEAAAAGRIPRVPAEPPALGPRPSAQRMFRTFMLGCVAAFPLYFVIQQVLRMLHVPGLATMAVLVALTMGLFWAMFARLARIGERSIEEFRLGYTTLGSRLGRLLGRRGSVPPRHRDAYAVGLLRALAPGWLDRRCHPATAKSW